MTGASGWGSGPDDSEPTVNRIGGILGDVVADAIAAIGVELAASMNDPASTIELRDGRYVGAIGPMRVWVFHGNETMPVQPETPATLNVKGFDPFDVTVLAVDDQDYVLGAIDELGESVPFARLSLEPWFIYDALRKRLAGFDASAPGIPLLESVLDIDDGADVEVDAAQEALHDGRILSAEQHAVARHATGAGVRFVWGPPGTGKTATLAATVRMLVEQGNRVCILAHANAAVDVAMARVAEQLHDHPLLAAGRILRVGVPHLEEVRSNPWINPDEVLRRQLPALVAERDELQLQRRALARELQHAPSPEQRRRLTSELEDTRARLSQVETRLGEARNELIEEAVVIGLTLSRLVINDLVWAWQSDVVIVDEASMAGLPFVVAAALRGATTLAFFGDFRQLPPIATSQRAEAQQWFGRDVFELAGVKSRVEKGTRDGRLAILRTQYRMGSDIANVVGGLAYFNMLRTDVGADERAGSISELAPCAGSQLVIVDTSELGTACLLDADPNSFSRFNLVSAVLSAALARRLASDSEASIGVISAYRAQARIVTELLRGEAQITSATTHRFQGSERDAIVLDLVDSLPQAGPSMLTGKDADLSLRLLNVAASRARGKLIAVVDLEFLQRHHSLLSPARQLIDLARNRGAITLRAADVIASEANDQPWCTSWSNAMRGLIEGNLNGVTHVDVSIPDESFDDGWLVELATLADAKDILLVCRAPVTVAVSIEETAAVLRLKTLGEGPIALCGSDGVDARSLFVGGRSSAGPAAVLRGNGVADVVWKYLTGEVLI